MDDEGRAGEERRVGQRRSAERRQPPGVLDLVSQAAHTAAQEVSRIERRRLVVQVFIAAFVVALAVNIPVNLIASHQRAADAKANSTYNCHAMLTIAETFSRFIASDAKLRYDQQHYAQRARVISAFSKILDRGLLRELQRRSDRIDAATQAIWTQTLQPRLDALARANCAALR